MRKGLTLEEAFKALNGRIKFTESRRRLKEKFGDFPRLANLARGEVYTAYFGNHESCDFLYDPTTNTLIQKYYDPEDTFKFKNIKTQADFENAVKDELGYGKITWEKKNKALNGKGKSMKQIYYVIYVNLSDGDAICLDELINNVKADYSTFSAAKNAIIKNKQKIKSIKAINTSDIVGVSIVEVFDDGNDIQSKQVAMYSIDNI